MVWFLVVGVVVVALAHAAPFPFVLERFAPAHAVQHAHDRLIRCAVGPVFNARRTVRGRARLTGEADRWTKCRSA